MPLVLAYAMVTGVRAFRDLYAKQIFSAALQVDSAPSWFFMTVDLPGAIASICILVSFSFVKENKTALNRMLAFIAGGFGLWLVSTALYGE